MRRALLALASCLLAAPAPGQPSGRPLTFQWRTAWNRHHSFGADGERLDSVVILALRPGGLARVKDRGTLKRSQLDRAGGYTEERTGWTVRWRGGWRQTGGRLALELERNGVECKKVIARRGEPGREVACERPAEKLTLSCETSKVSLQRAGKPAPVAAWRCVPAGGARMGGSPSPWVFGLRRCLRASRGPRAGLSYAPCE